MLDIDDDKIIQEAKTKGAQMVTLDRVVRAAAGALSPYEAIDKALKEGGASPANEQAVAELMRMRKLSPETLAVMEGMAGKTYEHFKQTIIVKPEVVKLIRTLRVERDYSWRSVARFCATVWGASWGGNQIAGMVICEKAARMSGENFLQPPWN